MDTRIALITARPPIIELSSALHTEFVAPPATQPRLTPQPGKSGHICETDYSRDAFQTCLIVTPACLKVTFPRRRTTAVTRRLNTLLPVPQSHQFRPEREHDKCGKRHGIVRAVP
jgi:hypothetical protein